LFVEANWAWVMPSPQDLPPATLDGGYGGIQRVILNRHDKHVNIVYGDGHAAPVKLRELYTQEWYPKCKMMRGLTIPKLPKY
jgi:prepilin-type processing-associated H-X9-DG protein